MNTALIGELVKLRYKLLWAKTRSRNGPIAQGVLSVLFLETVLAANILGFGMSAIFAETELRRYPLTAADRRIARHPTGILHPFWFLFFALKPGLPRAPPPRYPRPLLVSVLRPGTRADGRALCPGRRQLLVRARRRPAPFCRQLPIGPRGGPLHRPDDAAQGWGAGPYGADRNAGDPALGVSSADRQEPRDSCRGGDGSSGT